MNNPSDSTSSYNIPTFRGMAFIVFYKKEDAIHILNTFPWNNKDIKQKQRTMSKYVILKVVIYILLNNEF